MNEQKTLGRILCLEGIIGNLEAAKILWPIYAANSIEEIEDRLFVLKRGHKTTRDCTIVLEEIFSGLIDLGLKQRIEQQWPMQEGYESHVAFTRDLRERIGRMALEVFFDAVFERDKEAFWEYLPNTPRIGSIESIERIIAGYPINPRVLHIYLNYFTACTEATKRGHKAKIKRFIKFVLDEPLTPRYASVNVKVGVSKWTESARGTLANALVANGMYEECWDYFIWEAYYPLVEKFLGTLHEGDDGLMKCDAVLGGMSLPEALPKICESKELAHIWSVLTRFAVKQGRAQIIRTFNPSKPMNLKEDGMGMRTALLWNNPMFPAERIGI